jgi:predicted acetyltransferase
MDGLRLVPASPVAPAGLWELIREVGDGENGFLGEPDVVADSAGLPPETVLQRYLRRLVDMAEGRNLRPGWLPMTTHWLVDGAGQAIGMSRLRHRLTPFLREHGGHIGYYVAQAERGKGYGTAVLALTLDAARALGLERVLLTVDSDNQPSIRVIERNGGVMEHEGPEDAKGRLYRRYWIDL